MSDFLSNFSGENYNKTRQEKNKQKEKSNQEEKKKKSHSRKISLSKESAVEGLPKEETLDVSTSSEDKPMKPKRSESVPLEKHSIADEETINPEDLIYTKKRSKKKKYAPKHEPVKSSATVPIEQTTNPNEFIETDPTYKKKRRIKFLLIGLSSILALCLLYLGYYQITHVKVPDFEGKELYEAREWTTENGVKLKVEQKYDFDKTANLVIHQSVKNQKIKKGKELVIDASLGPNPEEKIKLPEFKEMKSNEAKSWIAEKKAENIAVIEEYSDTVAAGDYIKFEITNKDVKAEDYKRKDKAKVYFSKGKEVFQKDISVPDFVGKTKEEVTEWAKKNEITLKVEQADSDNIELGKIISQSIGKDSKIAKKDSMSITVSNGKAIAVPDFSQLTVEEAETKANDFQVQLKQVFNDTVPYGRFISQSVEAGKKFSEKDNKPTIQVVYSSGKPYIKDLRDNTLEGDLQRIFYEEYQSKGANITYQVYYVDSTVTKGTVVSMSKYNEFAPTEYVVQIGISKGNLQPEEHKKGDN